MGRKKLDMKLIGCKANRAKTFSKRKDGVLKKAFELSKLCDIQVCVIILGPRGEPPYVWPKEPEKLNNVLTRYLNTSPEERQKKAKNLSHFPNENLKKNQNNQLLNAPSDKQVGSMAQFRAWDDRINGFSAQELRDLVRWLDFKLGIVRSTIDTIKRNQIIPPKIEDVQCYGGAVQVMPSSQYGYPIDDHQRYHKDQIYAEAMRRGMMTNGIGASSDASNFSVGSTSTGSYGWNMNELPMWGPSPLACYYDHQNVEHTAQAEQFHDGRQSFRYGATNF